MNILDAGDTVPSRGGPSFSLANRFLRAAWMVLWLFAAAWTPRQLHPWRRLLLRLCGARMASRSDVRGSAKVWWPPHLDMAEGAVIGPGVRCYSQGPIILGRSALVSQRAYLCAGTHDYNSPHFQLQSRPIHIGASAWIGAEAFVGPGARIGEGAVLGARAVTFGELQPWTVYAGNPAKPVGERRRPAVLAESPEMTFVGAEAKETDCVVVLLTFNSIGIIRETATAALRVSPHIYVVDSGSTDGTIELLQSLQCIVVQRPFVNYGEQRNWAIAQVESDYAWQLHLDADEVLDSAAIREIRAVLAGRGAHDAYLLRRRDYFMGRMLRFSGVNPWHLRLFKSGMGHCESRLYDQHFITSALCGKLSGFMHDKNALTLSDWTARHNRWSDAEAKEKVQSAPPPDVGPGLLQPRWWGDARERTRFLKQLYYRLPAGGRALAYFIYRYVLRLGFLDGKAGFYFAFFQALWFRLLVDAKLEEQRK